MLVIFLKRLWQMLMLIALQVLVCNHIHLFGYATPMLYVLFLVHFPLNGTRVGNMLWAFAMGLIIDIFSNTLGEAAASMTLAAFVQWPLLQASAPKDSLEDMRPSYKTMGKWNHIRYIAILTAVHHVAFYLLEAFSFFSMTSLIVSLGASYLLSLVLMLTLETLRHGK